MNAKTGRIKRKLKEATALMLAAFVAFTAVSTDAIMAYADSEPAQVEEPKEVGNPVTDQTEAGEPASSGESTPSEPVEHVHEYEYVSNNDGTHTVSYKTEDCDYSGTVSCTYADTEDGLKVCEYCGYELVEEIPDEPEDIDTDSKDDADGEVPEGAPESEAEEPSVHEHVLEYEYVEGSEPASHKVTCKGILNKEDGSYAPCDFEEATEECAFVDGVCEKCGHEEKAEEPEAEEVEFVETTLEASVSGASVSLSGEMPEGATLVSRPVLYVTCKRAVEDAEGLESFSIAWAADLSIEVDGEEWQPIDDGKTVSITVDGASSTGGEQAYRIEDSGDGVTPLDTHTEGDSVVFETNHFTMFVIGGSTYTETRQLAIAWDDGHNSAGLRPTSVDVDVYIDGSLYDTITVTGDSSSEVWIFDLSSLSGLSSDGTYELNIVGESVDGYNAPELRTTNGSSKGLVYSADLTKSVVVKFNARSIDSPSPHIVSEKTYTPNSSGVFSDTVEIPAVDPVVYTKSATYTLGFAGREWVLVQQPSSATVADSRYPITDLNSGSVDSIYDAQFENGDILYTAEYTQKNLKWRAQFLDYDGSVISDTGAVSYSNAFNAIRNAPANPTYTDGYRFDGWETVTEEDGVFEEWCDNGYDPDDELVLIKKAKRTAVSTEISSYELASIVPYATTPGIAGATLKNEYFDVNFYYNLTYSNGTTESSVLGYFTDSSDPTSFVRGEKAPTNLYTLSRTTYPLGHEADKTVTVTAIENPFLYGTVTPVTAYPVGIKAVYDGVSVEPYEEPNITATRVWTNGTSSDLTQSMLATYAGYSASLASDVVFYLTVDPSDSTKIKVTEYSDTNATFLALNSNYDADDEVTVTYNDHPVVVTFLDYDGEIVDRTTYDYGETIRVPVAPDRITKSEKQQFRAWGYEWGFAMGPTKVYEDFTPSAWGLPVPSSVVYSFPLNSVVRLFSVGSSVPGIISQYNTDIRTGAIEFKPLYEDPVPLKWESVFVDGVDNSTISDSGILGYSDAVDHSNTAPATAGHTGYRFDRWTKKYVVNGTDYSTEDAAFEAWKASGADTDEVLVIKQTANYATLSSRVRIIFRDIDRTEISNTLYNYGDAVAIPAGTPSYHNKVTKYTFQNWGLVDRDVRVSAADMPMATASKIASPTAQYQEHYNEMVDAGEVVYEPVYTEQYVPYKFVWLSEDGETVLDTTEGNYYEVTGHTPAEPTKANATFSGWIANSSIDAAYAAWYAAGEDLSKPVTITFTASFKTKKAEDPVAPSDPEPTEPAPEDPKPEDPKPVEPVVPPVKPVVPVLPDPTPEEPAPIVPDLPAEEESVPDPEPIVYFVEPAPEEKEVPEAEAEPEPEPVPAPKKDRNILPAVVAAIVAGALAIALALSGALDYLWSALLALLFAKRRIRFHGVLTEQKNHTIRVSVKDGEAAGYVQDIIDGSEGFNSFYDKVMGSGCYTFVPYLTRMSVTYFDGEMHTVEEDADEAKLYELIQSIDGDAEVHIFNKSAHFDIELIFKK